MKAKDVEKFNKTAGLEDELRKYVKPDGKLRKGVTLVQVKRVAEIKKILGVK